MDRSPDDKRRLPLSLLGLVGPNYLHITLFV
jgi:hypothetical protein